MYEKYDDFDRTLAAIDRVSPEDGAVNYNAKSFPGCSVDYLPQNVNALMREALRLAESGLGLSQGGQEPGIKEHPIVDFHPDFSQPKQEKEDASASYSNVGGTVLNGEWHQDLINVLA